VKCVAVPAACRVRLLTEETSSRCGGQPRIYGINGYGQTTNGKGWYFSLGVGRRAHNSPQKISMSGKVTEDMWRSRVDTLRVPD